MSCCVACGDASNIIREMSVIFLDIFRAVYDVHIDRYKRGESCDVLHFITIFAICSEVALLPLRL